MKIIKKTVSDIINTKFREYALYTLQSRGIPSFDDSLTSVQRVILTSAKTDYEKTLSLVGSCISAGYSHGDASLSGAISKITREFNCSDNLLQGKGFWGSPVVHEAAAPRYTSVRLNPIVKQYFKYSHLNEYDNDILQPLHLKLPIGLSNITIGIAVGYKTLILPRKISDIEKYIEGKIKTVKPYFKNFTGKISKHKDGWVIKGDYVLNEKDNTVYVKDIPHLMKYSSFIIKLQNALIESGIEYKLINDSGKLVDIKIKCKNKNDLQKVYSIVETCSTIYVSESIVFIKDSSVITYDSIEDYLTDFKIRIAEIDYKELVYQQSVEDFNLAYEKAKLKYLEYMQSKERTRTEVLDFIKKFDKKIASKLDTIKLSTLNKNAIAECKFEIDRLTKLTASLTKQVKAEKKKFDMLKSKFKYTGSTNTTKKIDDNNDEIFNELLEFDSEIMED